MKIRNGTNPAECIKNARKIVLKIGSNTLAKKDGKINFEFMQEFATQCASLMEAGNR